MNNQNTAATSPQGLTGRVVRFASNQPAAAISFFYLLLSLIGLSFTWSLYRKFHIDYIDFADVTDFLMATLREPVTIAYALLALIVIWIIRLASIKQSQWYRAKKRGNLAKLFYRTSGTDWFLRNEWVGWVAFLVYLVFYINSYAIKSAEKIRAGGGHQVQYRLAHDELNDQLHNATLLGTSARFVFVYDLLTDTSQVIPQESLVSMTLVDPEKSVQEQTIKPATHSNKSLMDDSLNRPGFRDALNRHLDAVTARDLATYKQTLTKQENLLLIFPNGEPIETTAGVMDFHREWFGDDTWVFEPTIVKTIEGADMATALIKYDYRDAADSEPRTNWLVLVFSIEDGEWRLVHDQNTRIEK